MSAVSPIDWSDESIDWARFAAEVGRQIQQECLPEQLLPGLLAADEGEVAVVFERRDQMGPNEPENFGAEVARVPWWRVRHPDPDRLRKAAAAALDRFPTHLADQLSTAINRGELEVIAPSHEDWVFVHVRLGEEVVKLYAAHRRAVVDGWPEDEG
ncbi:MAG: hypothetical protein ACLGI8_09535 [Acidimicrobiia bacterium]